MPQITYSSKINQLKQRSDNKRTQHMPLDITKLIKSTLVSRIRYKLPAKLFQKPQLLEQQSVLSVLENSRNFKT